MPRAPSAMATARAVTWRDTRTGLSYTEEARVIVMAGGCVENPRLWLNSGLPDPNGWVGRGLTDHAFDWLIGVMPFDTASSKGPASAARAERLRKVLADDYGAGADRVKTGDAVIDREGGKPQVVVTLGS